MERPLIALLAALLLAPPFAAAAQDGTSAASDPSPAADAGPAREAPGSGRVYVGVGVGASVLGGGGSDRKGAGWRLRLGLPRSPRLDLGLEAGFTSGAQVDVTSFDVGATFFPWARRLYVRGAAGLSLLSRLAALGPGEPTAWASEQGVNLLVGVGVALGRPALTLNLEGQSHFTSLGAGEIRRVAVGSVWLGVDWY